MQMISDETDSLTGLHRDIHVSHAWDKQYLISAFALSSDGKTFHRSSERTASTHFLYGQV